MRDVDLNITSVEVKAETKAIKCEWNRSTAIDIQFYPDIEEALENELRDYKRKEVIKEIFG